jgi:hypothetical protein
MTWQDAEGDTAMDYATLCEYEAVVKILVSGIRSSYRGSSCQGISRPLHGHWCGQMQASKSVSKG